ncbi:MAG: aminopeptidase, partial [Candidatus Marinimicrobia bacterium]|nr:aminopeptidase [Candidatus Neomarinimicrobiota bacterium]
MNRLSDAIDTALRYSLAVKKGETVLVITDVHKRHIGIMFHEKAQKLKAQSMLVDIIPGKTDGEEPPEVIAKLMKDVDVLICPTSKSLTHTNARRAASKRVARTITLPGV